MTFGFGADVGCNFSEVIKRKREYSQFPKQNTSRPSVKRASSSALQSSANGWNALMNRKNKICTLNYLLHDSHGCFYDVHSLYVVPYSPYIYKSLYIRDIENLVYL